MQTTATQPENVESGNEYYGRLNRRYDARAKFLRSAGFEYEISEDYGSFFIFKRWGKKTVVSSAAMMYADDRAWNDIINGKPITR